MYKNLVLLWVGTWTVFACLLSSTLGIVEGATDQDGKLVGYAYISSKIVAASLNAAVSVREKTPFLQDAFVRDVNAAPITKADDPLTVDRPALAARLLADAKRIAGSNRAVSFVITQIQVAPTRPNRS